MAADWRAIVSWIWRSQSSPKGSTFSEASGGVGFDGGFVEAELDDGEIGVRGLEETAEFGAGEVALDLGELLDGVAEMDEHEVALVAELGEEGGLVGAAFGGGVSSGARSAVASARARWRVAESARRQAGQSKRNI